MKKGALVVIVTVGLVVIVIVGLMVLPSYLSKRSERIIKIRELESVLDNFSLFVDSLEKAGYFSSGWFTNREENSDAVRLAVGLPLRYYGVGYGNDGFVRDMAKRLWFIAENWQDEGKKYWGIREPGPTRIADSMKVMKVWEIILLRKKLSLENYEPKDKEK